MNQARIKTLRKVLEGLQLLQAPLSETLDAERVEREEGTGDDDTNDDISNMEAADVQIGRAIESLESILEDQ